MGHMSNEPREAFCEAVHTRFSTYATNKEAIAFLKPYWNCTDIVPRIERDEAISIMHQWCKAYDVTESKHIEDKTTYAQIARALITLIANDPMHTVV